MSSPSSALGDEWRTLTYQRAVATLERVPFRVQSAEQLAGVGGVGKQVAEKVKEILGTGTLAKLDSFRKDAKVGPRAFHCALQGTARAEAVLSSLPLCRALRLLQWTRLGASNECRLQGRCVQEYDSRIGSSLCCLISDVSLSPK